MNKLILPLSATESITITTYEQENFDNIDFCCSEVVMSFVTDQELCIGEQTAGCLFTDVIQKLIQVIDNKLQLHSSINENLGYMINEYSHDLPNLSQKFFKIPTSDNSSKYWIGKIYSIGRTYNTTNPTLVAWLYNDSQGNIIFEITPSYKWAYRPDEPENPDFITYEQFMENYQVVLHRIIPKETAQAWLEQIIPVYRSFFKTEQDYLNTYHMLLDKMPSWTN